MAEGIFSLDVIEAFAWLTLVCGVLLAGLMFTRRATLLMVGLYVPAFLLALGVVTALN